MIDYLAINSFGVLLSIILPYFIVYLYNKRKNKIITKDEYEKEREKILKL